MKKFLEELNKAKSYLYETAPINTEANQRRKELKELYGRYIGRRALHVSRVDKDSRVVTIKGVTNNYVIVSYKYYGMEYQGELTTCITYLSLLCGDDRLDVE
jgi:hypothetical protein